MANECLDLITEANDGRLDDDELINLIDDLQSVKSMRAAGGGDAAIESVEAAMFKRGEAIADDIMLEALNKKRMVLKDIGLEEKIMAMTREANEMVDQPILGLHAIIAGVNAPIEGAANSTAARARALNDSWNGAMIADLEQAKVLTQLNSMKAGSELEFEVGRVIESLNSKNPKKLDVSADALAIGKIIQKYQEVQLNRKNQAGAYIRKRDGFIGSQHHDPRKIIRQGGGKDGVKWKSDHMENVDWDAMRIPVDKRANFLDEVHPFLRRGEKLPDDITDFDYSFLGGNIAKRLSQHRVIIYKNSDSALKMNTLYGRGTLKEMVMADTIQAARSVALLDTLGSNPQAMVDRVKARLSKEYAGQDVKLDKIQETKQQLVSTQALLAEVTGDINIGSHTGLAVWSSNIRALKTLAALGRVILSVLPDVALNASNRIYHGRSLTQAWGDALSAPFKGMQKGEQRRVSQLLGVGINGQIGDMSRGFGAPDQLDGKMSRTMALFFKLNFLSGWTDANQRGVTMMLSHDLGVHASKSFDKLDEPFRRMLTIYDIDARKWEIARQSVETLDDGNAYLMPGGVADVRGSAFNGMSKAQQDKIRTETQESLFTLLTNEATIGVVEPGAREMAMMRRGYAAGSEMGQALRFMAQFKGFGISVLSRTMGRQTFGTGSKTLREALTRGNGANLGLVNAIVGSTVLGYVAMQMKEITKGREPREGFGMDVIFAAMAQGGGAGIYGDFLFGEYNRLGGGALGTIAGPVIGSGADLLGLITKLHSDDPDIRGNAIRLVKGYVPFANLLYLKDAFDYLIWYQLQETINPGYLARNERRIKTQNDQEMWLSPSDYIPRGGGFK